MKYLRRDKEIKAFGERLKSVRLSKNLTQEQVAFEAGIEVMQLSKIERGIINTSLSHIVAIAEALNVKPSFLFEFD